MDQVALNWLVISTTGSPLYVAAINLARGLPLVSFALIGGVVADRVDRLKMLRVTQLIAMILAIALFVVVMIDPNAIWAIILVASVRGTIVAFSLPARHTLVSATVPRDELGSAVALNSVAVNMSKLIGPMIAGIVIAQFGTLACFAVVAIAFTAVPLLFLAVRVSPREVAINRAGESFGGAFLSGIRYVRQDKILVMLVAVALVPAFFAQPYIQLLALYADDALGVGAVELGILTSTVALGGILGGVLAAHIQRKHRRGSIMLLFMGAFGLGVIAVSLAPGIGWAIPALLFTGMMQLAYNSSNTVIIQLSVDDAYRGRVMATLFTARGLMPLGAAAIATLASVIGTREAMGAMALVVVVLACGLWLWGRGLRRLVV